jgi:hypothetical protein
MIETREIHAIRDEIEADWGSKGRGVSPYARPYLDAMGYLHTVNDMYGADTAASIIRYFLSNATTWRGPVAASIKTELRDMIKGVY